MNIDGLGVNDRIVRMLTFLKGGGVGSGSFSFPDPIILTFADHPLGPLETVPKSPQPPPHTSDLSHTPLESVKDGGLHYIVPGRKFMEAFLLDLRVVFPLSIVILLLVIKSHATSSLMHIPCNPTCNLQNPVHFKTVPHTLFHLTSVIISGSGLYNNERLRKWDPESFQVGACRDPMLASYLSPLGIRFLLYES